ncbi:MAG: flagellar biosynthesis protein FlhA, partial [Bacillota bacterium]|nr:flagellar biosynthesis protein FlhA [Bacillota bacterium]
KGLPLVEALQRYTLLTVGDGLVTQIPALLLSTATGIIVTRAASEDNMGRDITRQLTAQPKIMAVGAGVLALLGLVPGLPTIPFLALAASFGLLARYMYRAMQAAELKAKEEERAREIESQKKPENVLSLLAVDPIELEIGYGLIPLVDPAQGGDLFDRVTLIRRQCALELGVVIPAIRVRDNMQLKPGGYSIKIKGVEVGSGELMIHHFLAMDAGAVVQPVRGIPTREPAFGLPALWIEAERREEAEMAGYTVVDPPSVLATHLTEVIKSHAYELLGRQEVKTLLDALKESHSAVVEELVPNLVTVGEIQKVLQNLLREGIPIRNLVTILEAMADHARVTRDPDLLTEYVRRALARQISHQYADEKRVLHVVTMDPALEDKLAAQVQTSDQGSYLALDPQMAQQLFQAIGRQVEKLTTAGHQPIILCSPAIRLYLKRLSERLLPKLIFLSYSEVAPGVEVESVGMVSL